MNGKRDERRGEGKKVEKSEHSSEQRGEKREENIHVCSPCTSLEVGDQIKE